MLLPFFVALLVSTSSACLSKLAAPPELAEQEDEAIVTSLILPNLTRQVQQGLSRIVSEGKALKKERRSLTRDVFRQAGAFNSANDDFGALFGIEIDSSDDLQLEEGESFEVRHDKILHWAAITNVGVVDMCVKALRVAEISGNLGHAQSVSFVDLLAAQTVLYCNYIYLQITNEEQLPPFISYLKSCFGYFKYLSLAVGGESLSASPLLSRYSPEEYPLIQEICEVLMSTTRSFLIAADPSNKLINSVEANRNIVVPDFIRVYLDLKALRWITADAVTNIFKEKFHRFQEVNEANSMIKRSFYERLSVIKKRMESQFLERSDFDDVNPAPPPALKKKVHTNTNAPQTQAYSSSGETVTPNQGLHLAPLVKIPETRAARASHAERKNRAAAVKAEKEEKRRDIEAAKHARLVAALEQEETDDKDVQLYYSSISQAASRAFDFNQTNQACKKNFPASARFRHSMYPTLTVSGTTINFLCSLLVSGTPDYDGFCAAHADLGGLKEEKRNGGKLFYFLEPFKYHKTLHRPHASSDFDHVLFRRFYRNCALHPYYFLLTRK